MGKMSVPKGATIDIYKHVPMIPLDRPSVLMPNSHDEMRELSAMSTAWRSLRMNKEVETGKVYPFIHSDTELTFGQTQFSSFQVN